MRQRSLLILAGIIVLQTSKAQDNKLWYNKPATVWTEALPIGNGRIGTMVFGGVNEELLQMNEATLWSGGPVKDNVNPHAPEYLPKLRAALFNEQYDEAGRLARKMQGLYSESYLPLGDIKIQQPFTQQPTQYYRDLNIQDGVATTTFTIDAVQYKREIFISAPDQVMVVRITASEHQKINCNISTSSLLHYQNTVLGKNVLMLKGKAPAHADPSYFNANKEPIIYTDTAGCRGMRFAMQLNATAKDGTVVTDTSGIRITNATEVLLLCSVATSFNGFDKCPDSEGKNEEALAILALSKAVTKKFSTLLTAHLNDVHRYFNRVSLQLNKGAGSRTDLPTDERLETFNKTGNDPGLEALYFQYGRYLLFSSSRTPDAPANLQGIWNKVLRAPWSSNYTTNINVQMNYWPAEAGNLDEMTTPLFGLVKNLAVTGKRTAKEFYNANGWVTHHNADIWALSNPVGDTGKGDPKWANWAMGANWLCRHLWEHYLYTGDKKFLQETAYPLMKGAAEFTLGWLVPDNKGHLVTAPSLSPENDFYYADKKTADISIATTMDMGIIRDLFDNTTMAAKILNTDKNFTDSIEAAAKKLYPFQIGSKGQLQEWYKDYEDVDPHHRHVSHLYALYPAHLISPLKTPELAAAAKRTLEIRGDDGTGWSLAWKVNFWARLLDGNHAHLLYKNLLRLTRENGTKYNRGGGAYPNLFDAHPPFQIDGNFAGCAGVMEMLLQSQDEIFLLPALPNDWKDGTVKGLVARGNFVVDMQWSNHQLKTAAVTARIGGTCTIRTYQPIQIKGLDVTCNPSTVGYVTTFNTVKGRTYQIQLQ
ncbi:MAG: glycoside hydrolase family 95 protein [Bacteroidetes bacterium]|nr:glycoside hydrolase family 95 protein [Bacteroidota bacterium]